MCTLPAQTSNGAEWAWAIVGVDEPGPSVADVFGRLVDLHPPPVCQVRH